MGPQGPQGPGSIVQDEGTVLTARTYLDFVGLGVTASDDPVNNRIIVSIPGNNGNNVNSVFGRTGAVIAATGDYTAAMVTNAVDQTGSYANPAWITALAWAKITGVPAFLADPTTTKGDLIVHGSITTRLPVGADGQVLTANSAQPLGVSWSTAPSAPVSSVFGRTGAIVAVAGDYTAAMVTNAVSTIASYADPAWITSLSWAKITGAPAAGVSSVFGRSGAVLALTGDYSAAMVTNAVDQTVSYADPVWITSLSWSKIVGAPTTSVSSVFGRSGAVVAVAGDYSAAMVTNAVDATQAYANPAWITSLAWSKITGVPSAAVSSVFGRTGAVIAAAGDYTAAEVTNAVDSTAFYADPAWITSLSWSKITGAPSSGVASVFGRTGAVVAVAGDYTAAQITNAVDSTQSYANPAWITSFAWSKITGAPSVSSYQTPWLSNINAAAFQLQNAGPIGIGAASPGYLLDVQDGGSGTSQAHIGYDKTDNGGYLYTASSYDFFVSGAASSVSGSWIPKAANVAQLAVGPSGVKVNLNTGLTVGTAFTPATLLDINTSGRFLIGTTQPTDDGTNLLQIQGPVRITQNASAAVAAIGGTLLKLDGLDNGSGYITHTLYANNNDPGYIFRRARNIGTSPTAVQTVDGLGTVYFQGFTGSNFQTGAYIQANADENWTTTARGTALLFSTVTAGSNTMTERMRLTSTGRMGVGTSTPGYTVDAVGDCNISGVYRVNGTPIQLGGSLNGLTGAVTLVAGTNITITPSGQNITIASTASGGSQTPWLSNIDGGGYYLSHVSSIGVNLGSFVTPAYALEVGGQSVATSQVHISFDGTDSGGYLTSTLASQLVIQAGAAYVNNWIAKATQASIINLSNGQINFYVNSGLTAGSVFSPIQAMNIVPGCRVVMGNPPPVDDGASALQIYGTVSTTWNGTYNEWSNAVYSGTSGNSGAFVTGRSARGSVGSPTATQANDFLVTFRGEGYGTSNWAVGSEINSIAEASFSASACPTAILFRTATAPGAVYERVRITSAGLVGIGISSPSYMLGISGGRAHTTQVHVSYDGTDSGAGAGGYLTADSSNGFYLSNAAEMNNNWIAKASVATIIGATASGVQVWVTSGLTAGNSYANINVFNITPSGQVVLPPGLGSGPTPRLLIEGGGPDGNQIVQILSGNGGSFDQYQIQVSDGSQTYLGMTSSGYGTVPNISWLMTTGAAWYIGSTSKSVPIQFFQNNAEVARIAANGNVGIAASTPNALLTLGHGDASNGFMEAQISFGYNNTSQYAHYIHTRHNTAPATNNAIDFYTSDGTANGVFPTNAILGMSIGDGCVGIAMVNPQQALDVVGQMRLSTGAIMRPDNAGMAAQFGNGANKFFGDLDAYNALGSTLNFTVLSANGYVGINQTSPLYKLDVSGQGGGLNPQAHISYDGSDTGAYFYVNTLGSLSISAGMAYVNGTATAKNSGSGWSMCSFGASGVWQVYAGQQPSGTITMPTPTLTVSLSNIGINTATPNTTMQVIGNICCGNGSPSVSRVFTVSNGGLAGIMLQVPGQSNWYIDNRGTADTPNNRLDFSTGGADLVTFLSNGNVGIGVANPSVNTAGFPYAQLTQVCGTLAVGAGTPGNDGIIQLGNFNFVSGSNWSGYGMIGFNMAVKSVGNANTFFTPVSSSGYGVLLFAANLFQFYGSSASTTAGQAVTPNELMRITPSGVGFGQPSPAAAFDAGTSLAPIKIATYQSGGVGYGMGVAGGTLTFGASINCASGTPQMVLVSGGYVGIGILSPSYQLHLSLDSAGKPSTNTWTIASDIRLKRDVRPFTDGLATVRQVEPIRYRYNGKLKMPTERENVGLDAAAHKDILPDCIGTVEQELDGVKTEIYNFNSHALFFAMINAIKELADRLEKLEKGE